MIREHDINWFLSEPERLLKMKPFTRGGNMVLPSWGNTKVLNNEMMDTGFANLEVYPISQDLYITEYRPDLHHIILNKILPKIKIVIDGIALPPNMMDLTQTASFQKLIHSAHVRNLTVNQLDFSLCNENPEESENKKFIRIKQEWLWRERDWDKYMAINTCEQLGNCAVLFSFDTTTNKYNVTNFSYEDGYQFIPNYDEYGVEIARSLAYVVDSKIIIDTFDSKFHYRCVKGDENGWTITKEIHGFPTCPLLLKRGKVAWEYAESSIEMWELMANIQAVALKRFGTFALVLTGELDKESFKRDTSTLVINLSSDTTGGKQDAKVLEFPEPQTMDGYLKTLEEKISLFSSTTFITPKDITTSNSGGNGIALAMSNDYALATQSALNWRKFVNDMVRLHQAGLDLETNGTEHLSDIRIGAKIVPWSLETNNTKITNLAMEAPYLSTRTIIEKSPDAAPDEIDRVIAERGALVDRGSQLISDNADKAHNIAINRNDTIIDNMTKVVDVEPATVNS